MARALGGWLLLGGAVAVGCGPSFQAIYEGDTRFEHCYALDDTPEVPMTKKAACWRDWTQHYTLGQTRDRVEYATIRSRALARVPFAPTDEALMGAAPGEGAQSRGVSAPSPTNAFAPPPKTSEEDGGAHAAPTSSALDNAPVAQVGVVDAGATPDAATFAVVAPNAKAPKADCTQACATTWQACKDGCERASCGACEKAYPRCVKACF